VQLMANRRSTSSGPLPVKLIGLAKSCTDTPTLSASFINSQKLTSSAWLPSTPGISIRSTLVACGAIQTESSLRLCAQLSHNARSVVLSIIAWSTYHCSGRYKAINPVFQRSYLADRTIASKQLDGLHAVAPALPC
jgi:hypothetical protein